MIFGIYKCAAEGEEYRLVSNWATVEEARQVAARLKRKSVRVNGSWADRFFVGHLEEV